MRLLILTSNQLRHRSCVYALAAHELLVIVEPKSLRRDHADAGMREYWRRVDVAEGLVFGPGLAMPAPIIAVQAGEISALADRFTPLIRWAECIVVFSASYLKPPLLDVLLTKPCLNLHVGVAPEYRGSAPNFWAMYDKRPDLVGGQVQRLSAGLDTGEILADVRPDWETDPFLFTMHAVQAGIRALVRQVEIPVSQWRNVRPNYPALHLRYSRHADFTPEIVAEYLARL